MQKYFIVSLLLFCGFFSASIAGAIWEPVDSAPNTHSGIKAVAVDLAVVRNGSSPNLCAAWMEMYTDQDIVGARWDGNAWIGQSFLDAFPASNNSAPAIAVSQDALGWRYAVWAEQAGMYPARVYVKHNPGANWYHLPGPSATALNIDANINANQPDMAIYENTPYVAWLEDAIADADVYVKEYNTFTPGWETMGTQPVGGTDGKAHHVSLAMGTDGYPVVAFQKGNNGSGEMEENAGNHIFAYRYTGTDWEWLGGTFVDNNSERWAGMPSVACNSSSVPYVAFMTGAGTSMNVNVKYLNGTDWTALPNPVSGPIKNPKIAISVADHIYICWENTFDKTIQVYHWLGSVWEDWGPVNTTDYQASGPSLACANEDLYIGWNEAPITPGVDKICVKRWIPPTPTFTPIVTDTATITVTVPVSATATPSATIIQTSTSTSTATLTSTPAAGGADIAAIVGTQKTAAYPVPASGQVNFAVKAKEGGAAVTVRVYNTHYRQVAEVKGQTNAAGEAVVSWDCLNIAPGVYFYQLVAGEEKMPIQKMIIAR
ncbi:T9SS type A sorting domain-containing protein [candidate division FCPU426 bacterium]|nr:T9SS type A sorting domain-containing protein [candidate division FCPU426 bacterium]